MGPEIVTIKAGGRAFTAVEDVTVEAGLDKAVRSFSLEIAAEPGSTGVLKPGTAVDILSNGDLMCRGYIDRWQPSRDEHEKSQIAVHGRGRGQDFVDCAATHDTGRFENQTLLQIAQTLDVFGVGIFSDVELEPIEEYQLTPGEKAFHAIEKLARKQGVTLVGEPDGRIRIAKAGTVRHAGGLFEPGNLRKIAGDLNWAHRHSKIIVRGQAADGDGEEALQVEATAEDAAVKRNRPLIIVEDGDIDQEAAQKRADTRRDREAGESLKASGTVQGFRDDGGKLWMPGNLVWVQSAFLGLTQVMLIKRAHFTKSGDGSSTRLTLIDPRAFGGKQAKGSKADDAWEIDDEDD